MNRRVTAPSLRRAACSRYNDGTHSATDPIEEPHTKDTGIARANCLPFADGVHTGTDTHQPACHAVDGAFGIPIALCVRLLLWIGGLL
jgi:hypothetical protein